LRVWQTTKWTIENLAPLPAISAATSVWVARWQEALTETLPEDETEAKPRSPNTIATYSSRLRAALRWAERQRFIDRAPYVPVAWEAVPASRAITGEEFDRILAAVPRVRPHDAPAWDRLLRALTRCNLRISELVRLSWDPDGEIRIEWQGGFPLIHKPPRANKTRRDRFEPALPVFWDVCCETPPDARVGLIFPLPNSHGVNYSPLDCCKIIAKIGAKAGVVTNPEKKKTATSHDIGRRGFLAQIDHLLTQSEAHKAMGHASFNTTATYYDTRAMALIAAKLWGARRPDPAGASKVAH
jgi:integrase